MDVFGIDYVYIDCALRRVWLLLAFQVPIRPKGDILHEEHLEGVLVRPSSI
jgi:hypothetical protein